MPGYDRVLLSEDLLDVVDTVGGERVIGRFVLIDSTDDDGSLIRAVTTDSIDYTKEVRAK